MLFVTSATLIQRRNVSQHGGAASAAPRRASPSSSSPHTRVSFRYVPRLTLLHRNVASIHLLNLLDGLQSLLAVTSALLWMVQAYPPYSTKSNIVYIQFVLTAVYIVDLLLRLSISGLSYVQTRWAVFDFVTTLPILYFMYQLGWYGSDGSQSTATAGFVNFVVAFSQVWSWLTLARFLRVFKLLRLTELRSMTFLFPNALTRAVVSLLLTVLMIIVLGGALMFVIENAWSYGEEATYQQWLYFMVVTISTVGYGDITPKTVLGQCMVMGIILFAIIAVPAQISDFSSALSDHFKKGLPYRRRNPHVVLVVPGTMSAENLDILLQEFFHSHHTLQSYHAVILSNGGEEHREAVLSHVRSTQYWSQISYIVGSPSSTEHLEEAAVNCAQAVFLLTASNFDSVEEEREADEETLRRAISIKRFCPYVPLIISLISPRSRAHVLWAQLSLFSDIRAVCLNELKMRLCATAATAPGAVGLVTNLLQSTDGASDVSSLFVDPSLWRRGAVGSGSDLALQTFTAESLVLRSLDVSAWPLTSSVCPTAPLPPSVDGSGSSLFFSAASRRWDEEYLAGYRHKLFACELPEVMEGLTFSEAAAMLYERLTLLLLALYRADPTTGELRITLNPGWTERVEVKRGDLACVVAQSEEHADAAQSAEYKRDIRLRWSRARTVREAVGERSDGVLDFRCNGRSISPLFPPRAVPARGHSTDLSIPSKNSPPSPPPPCEEASGDAVEALSQYVSDPSRRVDPVTGGVIVNSPPVIDQAQAITVAVPELQRTEFGSGAQEAKRQSEWDGTAGQTKVLAGDKGEGGGEQSGHVVICGYIDSRVIGFVRRFRATDHRPIVLVPISSGLSSAVERYFTEQWEGVRLVHPDEEEEEDEGSEKGDEKRSDEKDGSQKEGDEGGQRCDGRFLSYAHPCYGHRHSPFSSTPAHLPPPPSPSLDEFSVEDERVATALRSTKTPPEPSGGSTADFPFFAEDGKGLLSEREALRRSSWFRRASTHRASSVLILANPYTKAADTQDSSVDDQSRADSLNVNLYAAVQAYCRLCQANACPAMRPCPSSPLLSIELLFHVNARLLRHDFDVELPFRPRQPQETGLTWLYHYLQLRLSDDTPQEQRLRIRGRAAEKRERRKHIKATQLKQSDLHAEEQLDSADRQVDVDMGANVETFPQSSEDGGGGCLSESAAQEGQRANLQQRAKAFFTSDGCIFSAKLLDSLVVQAFYHPLVFDTIHALTQLPSHETQGRSFRTQLAMLDVPSLWVGRTFGFAQLSFMLDMGWVAMGVFRDRKAVEDSARSVRRAAREALGQNSDKEGADRGEGAEGRSGNGEGLQFYVLTNPPPDTVLHQHDRFYVVLQC